jgi:hypothetical protein
MSKPRKCRICKKRPVWSGGDVKNPGPFCKQCYHRKVWPERLAAHKNRQAERASALSDESLIPDHSLMDPDFYCWGFVRDDED